MTTCPRAVPSTCAPWLPKWQWCLVGVCLAALPTARAITPAQAEITAPSGIPLVLTRSGHLAVQISANGHAVRFVVDTACPITLIDSAAYPKLTLPGGAIPTVGLTYYPKSLDHRPAATGHVADLRIGGTPVGEVAAGVTALDAVLGQGNQDVEGILGTNLLLRHGAIIDLKSSLLLLDARPTQHVALAQRAAREGYTAITMLPTTGLHLAVPCVLANASYRLLVDTGSPATVMQRGVLESVDLVRPSQASYMRTLFGSTMVEWMPLANWSIGDFSVENAIVGTGNFQGGIFAERTSNGGRVEGLLGLEWLTHWRAIVDFGARKIYLKHSQSRPPIPANTTYTPQRTAAVSVPPVAIPQQPRQSKGR